MLLAVDVGNSSTVLGIFRNDALIAEWRVPSVQGQSVDEIRKSLEEKCADAGFSASELGGVGISSVVPSLTGLFTILARKYLHVEPVVISSALDLGLKIHYKDPMTVGADRLCNVVAGHTKYGGPLIIIDFGTATTFDVVSKEGDYLGGVITLGLESSSTALHRQTALLPKIELQLPASVVGRDTVASMQAGVMMGTVDAVEGMVRRIRKEIGQNAKVIATGGLASLIARQINVVEAVEPTLVLDGLRLIYERIFNLKKQAKP